MEAKPIDRNHLVEWLKHEAKACRWLSTCVNSASKEASREYFNRKAAYLEKAAEFIEQKNG